MLYNDNIANWAEYALVVATAISLPASVYSTILEFLAIELPLT